jgi:hypothetical protein
MPVVVVSYHQKTLKFINPTEKSLRMALLKRAGMGHVITFNIINYLSIGYLFS